LYVPSGAPKSEHFLRTLFRRKGVDACQADADSAEHRLKRTLGVVELTALGIGAVIGASSAPPAPPPPEAARTSLPARG